MIHPDHLNEPAEKEMPPAKIDIQNLNVYYGNFHALKNVSMKIPEGCVTAFIGPSGCGKSTLLRSLNRMQDLYPEQRAEGSIKLSGMEVLDPSIDVTALRSRVGMVFQRPTPFPMSIFDNIAYGVRLREKLSKAELTERVEWALKKAALWDDVKAKLNEPGTSLSGGQQQRLCIARGIAVKPEVLLLDEPCSALDPISTARIEDLINELKKDYTVVIVTHSMRLAFRTTRPSCIWANSSNSEIRRRSSRALKRRRRKTTSPADSAKGGREKRKWR